MPSQRHEQASSCRDVNCKTSGLEFDASERLRLMQSGLPLCIFLESSEVVALKPPAPLYVFVPRVSYLPNLIDKCHEHFKPYIQPSFGQPTSPFFDFCGIPIDWRLPIGVAFDILTSLQGGRASKLVESYVNGGTNHMFAFEDFLGWASFESFFINSLKQATYIINGSATPFQRLAKAAEMQLLTASRTGSIAQFLEGCNQLLPAMSPRNFRRIPVRLYVCGPPCVQLSLSFPCFKTDRNCCGAQALVEGSSYSTGSEYGGYSGEGAVLAGVSVANPDKVNTATRKFPPSEGQALSTLGDLVHHVLPQLFPKLSEIGDTFVEECTSDAADAPSTSNDDSEAEQGTTDARTAGVIREPGCDVGRRSCCLLVHGIQPLLQTPLFWLAATAPQLDMFLHVVVLVGEALMGAA